MFKKLKDSRYNQIVVLFLILSVILAVRLFAVAVVQNDEWSTRAENISTKTIYTSAPRGEIYDRYGRLLAGNRQSFSVRINASDLTKDELNETIVALIDIFDRNGDVFIDEFPIVMNGNSFEYTYDQEIRDWLSDMGFSTSLTAEEAFMALRSMYGIDPGLDRYDAQEILQNTYGVFPPISVTNMEYTYNNEKRQFIQRYYGNDEDKANITAEEMFYELRDDMNIDPNLSDAEARRIMLVRDMIKSVGYNQYISVSVAKNVSENTVMLIEEEGEALKGVEIASETTRYYPNSNTASHILGYVGVISEEEAAADESYENGAIVGKQGIEGAFEDVLRGTAGETLVQVNATGELVQVISETEPKKGQDIYLTIDLRLQEAAERGLENTIHAIQTGGTVESVYGNSAIAKPSPNACTGAVVAIEVETGDVLAMASFPDYDPNLFSQGISSDDWDSLQSANPRDPLAPSPLYNLATMSAVQPGSTFKPVTATAALLCGLDPNTVVVDGGAIELGGRTFGCVVWNLSRSNHGAISMSRALEVSCNYYFYDIATGYDWYAGRSLGYDIDYTDITDAAQMYGLGLPTGIEIAEAVSAVPSEENRLAILQTNLSYELYANAENWFVPEVSSNASTLDENIKAIKELLARDDLTWNLLYDDLLPSYGINEDALWGVSEKVLYDYYPQAKWSTADTFNLAIGQGENAYTPLQMANYIATLGNSGVRNQVSLIKSIEGQGLNIKPEGERIDVSQEYFDYILDGMRLVASGDESTVSRIFADLDVPVAAKTGTAERAGRINPPSEVDYIKEHLGAIAPQLSWGQVEAEMNRLMETYPETYSSKDTAVRRAVMNLAGVTGEAIDRFKPEYGNFAWVVALAPADDPKIAVVAMVPQGATAANAAPIVKEVLGAYFEQTETYQTFELPNTVR